MGYNKNEEFKVIAEKGREAFVMVYHDVLYADDIDPTAKLLYITLKSFANYDLECYPSIETIAKKMNTSTDTVIRRLSQLEKKGYIERKRRSNDQGTRINNLYILKNPSLRNEQKNSLAPTDQSNEQVNNNSDMQELSTSKMISEVNINMTEEKKQEVKRVNKPKKDQVDKKILDQARAIVENKLNDKEIISLLKAANNDLERIKNYYELSKTQNVKVLVKWLVAAIKKGFDLTPVTQDQAAPAQPVKNLYNSFPQRNYTKSFYDNLESRLLGV